MNKLWAWLLLAVLLLAAGCSSGNRIGSGNEQGDNAGQEADAAPLMQESAQSMQKLSRYAIRMQLNQELQHGDVQEKLKVNSAGTVSVNPLMMEQTVRSDYDGDVTELKTILTPNNYYIYDTTIGLWNKLSQQEIKDIRGALSDFQINPYKQMESLMKYAADFESKDAGGQIELTLTEKDKGAKALLADIMKSTLNGGEWSQEVTDSIQLQKLIYKATLDAKSKNLLRLDVVSEMGIELDPGVPMQVNQTLTVKYSEFNTAKAITVPKEAQDAPETMPADPSIDPGADEGTDSDAGDNFKFGE